MPGSGLTLQTPERRVVGGTPGLLAYAMDAMFDAEEPLLPWRAVVLPGGDDVPGPAPLEEDDGAPPQPLSSCFHLDSHGKVRSRVLLVSCGRCGERR